MAAALLWLLYALSLDLRYGRFPGVLIGASEILLVVTAAGLCSRAIWRGGRRVLGRAARREKRTLP